MLECHSWPQSLHGVLLLTLQLGLTGVATQQELLVIQPNTSISVVAGETVTLFCTVTSLFPVGPIEWFREKGQGCELVYRFTGEHFPRVENVADTSKRYNTNFSIRISNVTLADTGTYYCVKFQRTSFGKEELQSGQGTKLSVHERKTSSATTLLIVLLLSPKVLLVVGVSAVYIHKKQKA